jgi:hypothetical protein
MSNNDPLPTEAPVLANPFIDEETPLLRDDQAPSSSDPEVARTEETVLVDEPSTRRLVVILGSVYVGVFLGALDSTIIATLPVRSRESDMRVGDVRMEHDRGPSGGGDGRRRLDGHWHVCGQ